MDLVFGQVLQQKWGHQKRMIDLQVEMVQNIPDVLRTGTKVGHQIIGKEGVNRESGDQHWQSVEDVAGPEVFVGE